MLARGSSSFVLFTLLLLFTSTPAHAQWLTTTASDNPIYSGAGQQNNPLTVSDGAGGFVTVWRDQRTSGHTDLYAQSFDVNGFPKWTASGVVVDSTVGTMSAVDACPDDSGGMIVTWQRANGATAGRVMAQRLDANGQVRWGMSGVNAGTFGLTQSLPRVSEDGEGGAIVVWAQARGGSVYNVFGQRISAYGVRLWIASGDSLVARGEVRSLATCPRRGGGVWIAYWYSFGVPSVVAVDNAQARVFGSDSITTAAWQSSPPGLQIVPSGDGAIAMMAGGLQMHLRGFETPAGTWPASVRVVGTSHTQVGPLLASDDRDGALLEWRDGRPGAGGLYVHRIGVDGTPLWTTDGVFVTNNYVSNGGGQSLCGDGAGGAWMAWNSSTAGMAQHFRTDGGTWLPAGGLAYTVNGNTKNFTSGGGTLVKSANSSMIHVWATTLNAGTFNDIYAKRFFGNGSVSTTGVETGRLDAPHLSLAAGPNPARDLVQLRFALPRAGLVRLELFGLAGERVALLADGVLAAGEHSRSWNGSLLAPGVYHARLVTADGTATAKFVRVR